MARFAWHCILVTICKVGSPVPLGHVFLGVRVVGVVLHLLLWVVRLLLLLILLLMMLLMHLLMLLVPIVSSSNITICPDRLAIRVLHIPQRVLKQG